MGVILAGTMQLPALSTGPRSKLRFSLNKPRLLTGRGQQAGIGHAH